MIQKGRLHHAYLFSGIDGIGKRLVALNMAKALNCLGAQADACDRCRSCLLMGKGSHPDLLKIGGGEGAIGIDEIRGLQQSIAFKPYEARWRVVIIEGAERLTKEAANALLKTIEEPPPQTIIILLASAAEGLPPTVVSRCQKIKFSPLSADEVRRVLRGRLAEEEIELVAPLCGGSPGKGMQMDLEGVRRAKGVLSRTSGTSIVGRLSLAREIAQSDASGMTFLEVLGFWIRDLVIYRETGDGARLLNRDLLEIIRQGATQHETEELVGEFWRLLQIRQGIESYGNLQLALEAALLGGGFVTCV